MHLVHKYKNTDTVGAVIAIFFDLASGGQQHNQIIEQLRPTADPSLTTRTGPLSLKSFLSQVDFTKIYNY
jgi:hypothetical protein